MADVVMTEQIVSCRPDFATASDGVLVARGASRSRTSVHNRLLNAKVLQHKKCAFHLQGHIICAALSIADAMHMEVLTVPSIPAIQHSCHTTSPYLLCLSALNHAYMPHQVTHSSMRRPEQSKRSCNMQNPSSRRHLLQLPQLPARGPCCRACAMHTTDALYVAPAEGRPRAKRTELLMR